MKTKLKQYRTEESATTFVGFEFANDLNEKGELLLSAEETAAFLDRMISYHGPRCVRLGETVIRTIVDLWGSEATKDGWQKAAPNAAMKKLGAALRGKCKTKLASDGNDRTMVEITISLLEAIVSGKFDDANQWPKEHSGRIAQFPAFTEALSEDQWSRIGCYLLWTPPVKKEKVSVELPVIDF